MEQQNLKQKDLTPYLGSQSRVSEILNGKRKLSKSMILNLHTGLGIPLEVLLGNLSKNSVSGSNELNESRKKLVYS
jgi:HTH-type transcriptional regulator/antitoxin HigA